MRSPDNMFCRLFPHHAAIRCLHGKSAPKQKYNWLRHHHARTKSITCKSVPAPFLTRVCISLVYYESRIKQEDSLFSHAVRSPCSGLASQPNSIASSLYIFCKDGGTLHPLFTEKAKPFACPSS